jgi:hypothetical protein
MTVWPAIIGTRRRGQPATSKVLRDEAAPAPLVLQLVENILGSRRDRDTAVQNSRACEYARSLDLTPDAAQRFDLFRIV